MGQAEKYLVYKNYPVTGRQSETKEIAAENMVHLKFTRRLHQTRGTSMLSGVLMRISALKEYEDAELVAARIAAALGLYIRKGDGQDYEEPVTNKDNDRELHITPGIIYDDLRKGKILAWLNLIGLTLIWKLFVMVSCGPWRRALV